jgi:hypothetical protein
MVSLSRLDLEGRMRYRHETRGGMRWPRQRRARLVVRTNGAEADGEIVWSWPPDAEVKSRETDRAATVANKPGHRGEYV